MNVEQFVNTGERPTALVTWATSELGRAFARELLAAGYDLVVVDRSPDRLEALRQELDTEIRAIPFDLAPEGASAKLGSVLRDQQVTVRLLVHPAGFTIDPVIENFGGGNMPDFWFEETRAADKLPLALIGDGDVSDLRGALIVGVPFSQVPGSIGTSWQAVNDGIRVWVEFTAPVLGQLGCTVSMLTPGDAEPAYVRRKHLGDPATRGSAYYRVQNPAEMAWQGLDGLLRGTVVQEPEQPMRLLVDTQFAPPTGWWSRWKRMLSPV